MEERKKQILIVVGTRPEAIKMAPVVSALAQHPRLAPVVCATGQHNELLHGALSAFGLTAAHDLRVMTSNQTLNDVTARVIVGMAPVIASTRPDLVLVHGDTTTTLSAALAAFYARVPVGHVEAGLRSFDFDNPYPEEANRVLVDQLAAHCYAPTEASAANLRREGIAQERIVVTGNTAIDALLHMRDIVDARGADAWRECLKELPAAVFEPGRRMVLVTAHRRENFGEGLRNVCRAVAELAAAHPDWFFVYPVHPNPHVREAAAALSGIANVCLISPVEYEPFVCLMSHAFMILTDSGGIQEEAPSLGKPVLVLREKTERMEGVDSGTVLLVGTDRARIVAAVESLGSDRARYEAMVSRGNPYGDGHAAERIVEHIDGVLNAASITSSAR